MAPEKRTTVKVLAGLVRPQWRGRAHQCLRHRARPNQGAARAFLFAAASEFSSAPDLHRDHAFLCAASRPRVIPLRSDARTSWLARVRARAHRRTFRRYAATARTGVVALARCARPVARRTGIESRSGLAKTVAENTSLRSRARQDRPCHHASDRGNGTTSRIAACFAATEKSNASSIRTNLPHNFDELEPRLDAPRSTINEPRLSIVR